MKVEDKNSSAHLMPCMRVAVNLKLSRRLLRARVMKMNSLLEVFAVDIKLRSSNCLRKITHFTCNLKRVVIRSK